MSEEMMQESVNTESPSEASYSGSEISEAPSSDISTDATEDSGSHDYAAAEDLSNDSEEDLNSDNANFAKKRIDRKNKRRDQELEELRYVVKQLVERDTQQPAVQAQDGGGAYYGSQSIPPENYYQQQQQMQQQMQQYGAPIIDPQTGLYIAPGTERYNAVLNYQQQQAYQAEQERYLQERKNIENWNDIQDSFDESIEKAASKYNDYDDVVKNNQNLSKPMLEVAQMLPEGGEFLYYLAKNPKEMVRISRLHPYKQQKAVAAHAMKFAARKNVSSAPAPINHLQENSKAHSDNIANMSFDDLRAYLRNK
jgi:hypothetical protein